MLVKMTRILTISVLLALLAGSAFADFTIEEVTDEMDRISIITFPLIVSPDAFENSEDPGGAFYDDPDSRYLRCPNPVLVQAMRFGQLISFGTRYDSVRKGGGEREITIMHVAHLLDRLRLRKVEDFEGAKRCWFTFVSLTEDISAQRMSDALTVENYWEVENLGAEYTDKLWELVRIGIAEHLELKASDRMKPLPQEYSARVSSVELLEYSYEDGELYIKLNMWFEEIDEDKFIETFEPYSLPDENTAPIPPEGVTRQ